MGKVLQLSELKREVDKDNIPLSLDISNSSSSSTVSNHSYPMPNSPITYSAAQPLGSMTDNSSSSFNSNANSSSSKDTIVVLLTLTAISITIYFSYNLWKKHRRRVLSASSKLEEYRYSRLSQSEIDVDNVQFTDPLCQQDESLCEQECDDRGLKPATLQLETDSFITITDANTSQLDQNQSTTATTNGHSKSSLLIDDLSDELSA